MNLMGDSSPPGCRASPNANPAAPFDPPSSTPAHKLRCFVCPCAGVVFLLMGCVEMAPRQEVDRLAGDVQRVEQTQAALAVRVDKVETDITGIAGDVSAVKITTTKEITNEVWPWLLTGLGALVIAGVVALLIVWWIVRTHSYEHQKPRVLAKMRREEEARRLAADDSPQ
jgi:hypothetical protein